MSRTAASLLHERDAEIVDAIAYLRGPVHGRIQTLRGMCTDGYPHVQIDRALAELDAKVHELIGALRHE